MPVIEVSPSNRARCSKCDKNIGYNKLRIAWPGVPYSKKYHLICYKRLKKRRCTIRSDFNGINKLTKNQQNEINKILFPNEVKNELKPKLILNKCLNDMKIKEIKLELDKRGLRSNYKDRKKLKNNLREYYEKHISVKQIQLKQTDKLIKGYIKNQEHTFKFNVPFYLTKLIAKYYPIY